jgi:hypothetical protein
MIKIDCDDDDCRRSGEQQSWQRNATPKRLRIGAHPRAKRKCLARIVDYMIHSLFVRIIGGLLALVLR